MRRMQLWNIFKKQEKKLPSTYNFLSNAYSEKVSKEKIKSFAEKLEVKRDEFIQEILESETQMEDKFENRLFLAEVFKANVFKTLRDIEPEQINKRYIDITLEIWKLSKGKNWVPKLT